MNRLLMATDANLLLNRWKQKCSNDSNWQDYEVLYIIYKRHLIKMHFFGCVNGIDVPVKILFLLFSVL